MEPIVIIETYIPAPADQYAQWFDIVQDAPGLEIDGPDDD
jgi:hypothetical protein